MYLYIYTYFYVCFDFIKLPNVFYEYINIFVHACVHVCTCVYYVCINVTLYI